MYINEVGTMIFVVISNGEVHIENYSEYADLEFVNEMIELINFRYSKP